MRGPSWIPRTTTLREEIGHVWGHCGIHSEWEPMRAVLLHRPGAEVADTGAVGPSVLLNALFTQPLSTLYSFGIITAGVPGYWIWIRSRRAMGVRRASNKRKEHGSR